jgi:hypothetical protein
MGGEARRTAGNVSWSSGKAAVRRRDYLPRLQHVFTQEFEWKFVQPFSGERRFKDAAKDGCWIQALLLTPLSKWSDCGMSVL